MFEHLYKQEIEAMISKMTQEEKAYALTPLDNQYCSIPSQDFYGPTPQDVPAGGSDNWRPKENLCDADGRPADGKYHPVAFPSNSSVAMGWDKELTYRIGSFFALEAKANPVKVNILNRPGMNLKRSPLCGRNYDYLSEDPVMTGILASEYVKGIQSQGIGACPKHFIANNQEFDRMNTDSVIAERVFHEVYLRPWKMVLQDAKPWMIMSSYNKVNGDWVNSNSACMKLLREDIGYDGVVVSDYMAIHHNKVKAHNNQMDIELADQENHTGEILEALKTGAIKEETIDRIVRRQLGMALHALSFDNTADIDLECFHEEAVAAAEKCIVLLKNEGILPLDPHDCPRILVAGELAVNPNVEGSGSGYMNGYRVDRPYEELCKRANLGTEGMVYAQGYELIETIPPSDAEADPAVLAKLEESLKDVDLVLAFVGAPYGYETEGYDRPHIRLPKNQQVMLDMITGKTDQVVIVLTGGSIYDLAPWNDKVKGILFAGMAGEGYGTAIARVLYGEAEPGGRLAETFPLEFEHTPAYFDFAASRMEMPHVNYSEGLLTGYRWYDTRHIPVLYPFGHGLSYTTFEYGELMADKEAMSPDEMLTISMDVTNTGTRSGSQVIQLYIHENGGLFRRPQKELRNFEKVYLQPGETKRVSFSLSRKDFEVYSDVCHKWGVQSDTYEILLNTSAAENVGRYSLRIEKGDQMYFFNEMSPLAWFLECPAFHTYLEVHEPVWKQEFFTLGKTDFLVLMLPLPFYRMAEALQGEALFTKAQIGEIIECCNRYMAEC